jgi:predicted nucleic acid-binding protein
MAAIAPAYFDSALIAKFYVNESGRDVVRSAARSAGVVVTSGIAVAEVSAAFHRKLREGAIDVAVFNALQAQFEHDLTVGLWRCVGPMEVLLDDVRALFSRLDKHMFLRSVDALHLVTARSENFIQVHSKDRHLLAACSSVGLQGVNPLA